MCPHHENREIPFAERSLERSESVQLRDLLESLVKGGEGVTHMAGRSGEEQCRYVSLRDEEGSITIRQFVVSGEFRIVLRDEWNRVIGGEISVSHDGERIKRDERPLHLNFPIPRSLTPGEICGISERIASAR